MRTNKTSRKSYRSAMKTARAGFFILSTNLYIEIYIAFTQWTAAFCDYS